MTKRKHVFTAELTAAFPTIHDATSFKGIGSNQLLYKKELLQPISNVIDTIPAMIGDSKLQFYPKRAGCRSIIDLDARRGTASPFFTRHFYEWDDEQASGNCLEKVKFFSTSSEIKAAEKYITSHIIIPSATWNGPFVARERIVSDSLKNDRKYLDINDDTGGLVHHKRYISRRRDSCDDLLVDILDMYDARVTDDMTGTVPFMEYILEDVSINTPLFGEKLVDRVAQFSIDNENTEFEDEIDDMIEGYIDKSTDIDREFIKRLIGHDNFKGISKKENIGTLVNILFYNTLNGYVFMTDGPGFEQLVLDDMGFMADHRSNVVRNAFKETVDFYIGPIEEEFGPDDVFPGINIKKPAPDLNMICKAIKIMADKGSGIVKEEAEKWLPHIKDECHFP